MMVPKEIGCIEIENFFENPDQIRQFGLNSHPTNYVYKPDSIWSGYRSPIQNKQIVSIISDGIQFHCNKKIKTIDTCFHFNPECSKQGFPHIDGKNENRFAGVIYLSKKYPQNCGTTIYESNDDVTESLMEHFRDKMEIMYDVSLNPNNFFKNLFSEELTFIKENYLKAIVSVEFKYNKMICYPENILHSPDFYFGDAKENCRMTIAFHGEFDAI